MPRGFRAEGMMGPMKPSEPAIAIPEDIAAKCDGPNQFKRFDSLFRAVIAVPRPHSTSRSLSGNGSRKIESSERWFDETSVAMCIGRVHLCRGSRYAPSSGQDAVGGNSRWISHWPPSLLYKSEHPEATAVPIAGITVWSFGHSDRYGHEGTKRRRGPSIGRRGTERP